jgi:hypothetical protein
MALCPIAVDRKVRELTIQAAFDYRKNNIIKRRNDAKAQKARLREIRLQQQIEAEFESTF